MSLAASEIALLTGNLDDAPATDYPGPARQLLEADFTTIFTSAQAKRIFTTVDTTSSANASLGQILSLRPGTDADSELELLTLAIACLHAYLQANWTGPPLSPPETFDSATLLSSSLPSSTLDALAISELARSGEPAYHLSAHPTLLRLAQLLLDLPYTHLRSVPWWRLRLYNVHLQVLDEPVPPPPSLLSDLSSIDISQLPPDLAGTFLLEQGLLHHRLGDDKVAAPLFVQAARATGLNYELTGALGRRTKFQTFDVSQLVLLAESRARSEGTKTEETKDILSTQEPTTESKSDNAAPETLALNDDTLLEHTHFTSSSADTSSDTSPLSHIDPNAQPPLHPLDTSILLALCLNVRNTSPANGLTASQMTPYVSRALTHSKNWSVHTLGLLLRSRLERTRTRTAERSVLQLQALVDQMPSADTPVPQRLAYIHALALPSKWELERELARAFVSLGVLKSALEIFERLEMWEDAVGCYGMLERREQGIKLVKDLLEGGRTEADVVITRERQALSAEEKEKAPKRDMAREAKLWCLLGDLEPANAKEHYTHAWELSNQTSARAARSLGGLLFNSGEFKEAIPFLRAAVRVAPLWGRTWFVLGCAYTRAEDWEGARESFMRCVAIDDEDAESWNNLASTYLRLAEAVEDGEEKDTAVPFANKTLAFRALQHGVRRAHDNWRMWANLAIVATDVGELAVAARSIGRVVEERAARDGAASLDMDVLERLVAASCSDPGEDDDGIRGDPNTGSALYRRVLELFERTILPRLGGELRIFRAYARMLIARSKWTEALQAHTEAYRCSGLAEFKADNYDEKSWEGAAREIGELVEVLRLYGPRAEPDSEPPGRKYIVQARSVLRTFVARSKESFEGSPGWRQLEELGEEIKKDLE